MKFNKFSGSIMIFLMVQSLVAQEAKHWTIKTTNEIRLDLANTRNFPYSDNIEMSGKRVAGIISYAINEDKKLSVSREIFFPQLRTFIKTDDPEWKQYRAYFKDTYQDDILPQIVINDKVYVPGKVNTVIINGTLEFEHSVVHGVSLKRTFYPSMSQRLFVEQWTLTNTLDTTVTLKGSNTSIRKEAKGVKGSYAAIVNTNVKEEIIIKPGGTYTFSIGISATLNEEEEIKINDDSFFEERLDFLNTMKSNLILETPDKTLNTLFEFSKIRASESIFESKLGLIHSPGGGRYYVGFWANDQAEYVNPFFPYLGYDVGNDAAMNMFEVYSKEIDDNYNNIRYSFEIEGDAPINPLDRGDAAMIAYGASQFALANGDKEQAKKLWPLITWCLAYNHRQLNSEGVVSSESDEMEGRIPTGDANLSTSSLYYGALHLAYDLGLAIGKSKQECAVFKKRAKNLEVAIEKYFGARIDGLDTYKYYKEHKNLRHWICLPLVVQLFDRKDDTIEALFNRLWSDNGLHVEKNNENEAISKIFWDRATLYALRGTFLAGATERSAKKLIEFSNKRLLGDRVPYVVEAYPEGSMAHLSAESGLYCRVFTEGILGIVPTGLNSFKCTPRLPKDWNYMKLKNINAYGQVFQIDIQRTSKKLAVKIINAKGKTILHKNIVAGEMVHVSF